MKTILVIGGAGYVGSALVPALLNRGYQVRVLDLYLFGTDVLAKHNNLTQIKGDIRSREAMCLSLEGAEAVIHLACISNDPSFELDPALGKSINYDAFSVCLEEVKRAGVKRFIYASSSSVYGIKSEPLVSEDLSLEPLTDYSKYKALCEELLFQETDFTPVILRPATVCGYSRRLRLDVVVNIMTNAALMNKKIIVYGGSQKRPNIHIHDMVEAYIRVLEASEDLVRGQIFNVGGENMTLKQIAETVQDVLADLKIAIEEQPTNDLRSYHISSEKINRVLGWSPSLPVSSAVESLREAYESGQVPNSLVDIRYSNIKTLQAHPLSLTPIDKIERL